MERWLLILRHGKAERGPQYETDYERPLAPRGKHAAAAVGQYLAGHQPPVDLICSSSADRAIATARLVQEALGEVELIESDQAYAAGLTSLLGIVAALPDTARCVLLVGHNPGLEELAARLSGEHGIILKTCSLARIILTGESWAEALKQRGELAGLQHPRELDT